MSPRARKIAIAAALCVLSALIGINALAYQHARAMLTFATEGQRTGPPEKLSALDKIATLFTGVTVPRPTNEHTPAKVGLTHTTELLTNGEVTLEAWRVVHPEARGTVAIFHGYAASKDQLLTEARALYDKGLSLYMVDFRGSGGSNQSTTSAGYHEAADVALAVGAARKPAGEGPLFLFGYSMGAAAILRAVAVEGVEADGIILGAVFDRMHTTVGNRFEAMGLPKSPGTELLLFWGSVVIGADANTHNPDDYAAAIDTPTLMLHGAKDPRARLHEAEAVFENLHDPDKKLVVFPDLGHASPLKHDPKLWNSAIDAFIARLEGRSSASKGADRPAP